MTAVAGSGFPPWHREPPPPGSWRALFQWGDPDRSQPPAPAMVRLVMDLLAMSETDFQTPRRLGLGPVRLAPPRLAHTARRDLEAMLGAGNVQSDDFARLAAATGKGMLDLLRLRCGLPGPTPDAVLHPRDRHDLVRIVEYCARGGIAVLPRGGATSVTRALECPAGGVALDLRTHMDRILRFNETSATVTVQPGIRGPRLEAALNRAPDWLGAAHPHTCGHFPQSFEFSTVGGWVATRGAGQNSSYFGKIEDLVLAQEFVTPAGTIRTLEHPAAATGPDIDQILLGSEGTLGVLAEATLRVFRLPRAGPRCFSYLFPDWGEALEAAREVLQDGAGAPSLFRLSDPAETEAALARHGLRRPALDAFLGRLGLHPGRRCLLLGWTEGEAGFQRNLRRRIGRICRGRGAVPATGWPGKAWARSRFQEPYLRDHLLDFGVLVDTLECAASWDGLARVHRAVQDRCRARPGTACLAHVSHAYPQGASLYFVLLARLDTIPEYQAFQAGLLDVIRDQGAAMSHHHGIGRMAAPWLAAQLGPVQMDLLRAIKRQLDPQGIMNPGGTLGLD